jgi:hypothetical protein
MIQKGLHLITIPRYSVIPVVAQKYHSKPLPYRRYGVVESLPEFFLQGLQLSLDSLPHASALHDILAVSGPSAAMGKSQKVKGLRLPLALLSPVFCRKPSKLQKTGLVGIKFQTKSLKASSKRFQKPSSLLPILKADNKVVGKTHDDHIALSLLSSPLVGPKIQHIMQVDVRQKRTDTPPLRHSFFRHKFLPLLHYPGLQPLLYVSSYPFIRYPVLDELYQPFVVDGVKIPPNVGIQHPAYLSRHDPCHQSVQRIMGTAPRSESIRETEKICLVDAIQYLYQRPLDDLVLKNRHPQWPLLPIRFWYVSPTNRLGSVRPAFQPFGKFLEILLPILSIVPPGLPVYPRRGFPLQPQIGGSELTQVIDMVPERCKLLLPIPAGSLPYPFHRTGQAIQFELVFLSGQSPLSIFQSVLFSGTESGACFGETSSPWSGPFPPPLPPIGVPPTLVRRLPRYLWACPTSPVRSSLSCPLEVHSTTLSSISQGQTRDLPVPVQKVSRRAQGLRPRGANTPLALARCIMLPSVQVDAVGTPDLTSFRGSIPGPPFPLPTLRLYLYRHTRMTRGRCGWLRLHRMELSSTTFCRSPGAPTSRFIAARPPGRYRFGSQWESPGSSRQSQ